MAGDADEAEGAVHAAEGAVVIVAVREGGVEVHGAAAEGVEDREEEEEEAAGDTRQP